MKKIPVTLFFFITLFLLLFQGPQVYTNLSAPPSGNTGAPGDNTCAQASCHGGGTIDVDASSPKIEVEEFPSNNLLNGYSGREGTTIDMILSFNQTIPPNYPAYGFSMTALYEDGTPAGTMLEGAGNNANFTNLTTLGGREYLGHNNASSTSTWLFKYQFDQNIVQDIIFYIAANGANGNNAADVNDDIYLAEYRLTPNSFGFNNGSCDAEFMYNDQGNGQYNFSPINVGAGASYNWDFDNGDSSSIANPGYQYTAAGQYNVCLTINQGGCSDTYCEQITVSVGNNNFSLSGNVSNGANSAQSAIVYLIDATNFSIIDSQNTQLGNFEFDNLNSGNYHLKAALKTNDPNYNEYFPTYAGSELFWADANNINLNSNLTNNILMVQGFNTGGFGAVSGNIRLSGGKQASSANVPVLLLDMNDDPEQYTYSNASGDFEFDDIAPGTYQVYAEVLGKETEPAVVNITSNQQEVEGLQLEIQAQKVVEVEPTAIIEKSVSINLQAYPNPAQNQVFLEFELLKKANVEISVTDLLGREMIRQQLGQNSTGKQNTQLDLTTLSAGVFILNLYADGQRVGVKRVFVE